MKINIIAISKARNNQFHDIAVDYLKKTGQIINILELEEKNSFPASILKEREGGLLRAAIPKSAKIICLDERGKNLTSIEFAESIRKYRDNGDDIAFVIGGAGGLSDDLKESADMLISFGKMTWPHMMARMMLAEQLYRVFSIFNNSPYHKA